MSEPSIVDVLVRPDPLADLWIGPGQEVQMDLGFDPKWGRIVATCVLSRSKNRTDIRAVCLPASLCFLITYHGLHLITFSPYQPVYQNCWLTKAIDILRLPGWISAYPISFPLFSISFSSSIHPPFPCLLFSHLSDINCEVPAESCLRIISGLN